MPNVHPTAITDGSVELAEDVVIGPFCVLDGRTGPIRIGAGSRLVGSVYLTGPLTIGERNLLYPFACLGFSPQDLKWDPARPGAGVVVGDGNTFREQVTIHRATTDDRPTTIGNDNFWMACSHAGHDASVANNCIFANAALLGGWTEVADRANVGGATTIHQFCRIGRGCMLSGAMGLSMDLPPFFMLTGNNVAGSINLIGLRRSGASTEEIASVKWVYKTLYRSGLSRTSALAQLRARADDHVVKEYIAFIESSKRGICPGTGKAARSALRVRTGADDDLADET